jgi:hypothetical protein
VVTRTGAARKLVEALPGDGGDDVGAPSPRPRTLLHHHQATGAGQRVEDEASIPRLQGEQVDHLGGPRSLAARGGEGGRHRVSGRHEVTSSPRLDDAPGPERDHVLLGRLEVVSRAVQGARLEDEYRVVICGWQT